MKISICIPVMGISSAKVLCSALHSILLQEYNDVELILQDGDPERSIVSDSHVDLLLSLFDFKYAVGRDGGIFDAVNKCLQQSTGNILYFMCSDDLLCPGALTAVNAAFEAERFGGPYWLYGQTVSADVTGKTLGVDGAPTTYEQLLERNCIGEPAVFWNRQLMELAGKFDLRYRHAADYELWLRFWERREPLFLEQTLGIFRHHADQHSKVNAAALEVEAKKISTRHQNFSGLITRAHNVLALRRSYPDGIPESGN